MPVTERRALLVLNRAPGQRANWWARPRNYWDCSPWLFFWAIFFVFALILAVLPVYDHHPSPPPPPPTAPPPPSPPPRVPPSPPPSPPPIQWRFSKNGGDCNYACDISGLACYEKIEEQLWWQQQSLLGLMDAFESADASGGTSVFQGTCNNYAGQTQPDSPVYSSALGGTCYSNLNFHTDYDCAASASLGSYRLCLCSTHRPPLAPVPSPPPP